MAGKRTKDTNEDTSAITTQEEQDNLDQRPDDGDTTTSAEAQAEQESQQNADAGAPDTSGAPKSEDAPDVGPTPETPAVTSATSGPEAGVTTEGNNDTSGTDADLDSTFGVPGSDGEAPNPNITSDQVDGMSQMPGHTPEDIKARESYQEWFSGGPRCGESYCNKPEGHADGNVDPAHGWVNVQA